MERTVVKRHPAAAAGLLILLLSGTFGCATNAGTLQSEAAAPKERPAAPAVQAVVLKDIKDQSSYGIGLDIGRDLQKQDAGLKIEPLLQGIRDGIQGNKALLSDAELDKVRLALVKERSAARAKALGPQAEKNLAEGEAFLRENARKEGVKTLPDGLQYRVIKRGEGDSPGPQKNVKAHYVVRTIDGTELESTYKSGNPGIFPVSGVIPAWTEALQMMKEGEKWELYAPPHLAYGEKGIGKDIGPFQTVIFELELLGIH